MKHTFIMEVETQDDTRPGRVIMEVHAVMQHVQGCVNARVRKVDLELFRQALHHTAQPDPPVRLSYLRGEFSDAATQMDLFIGTTDEPYPADR